jgi:uncharacterized hydrophobic protein (TIGR00271 family)
MPGPHDPPPEESALEHEARDMEVDARDIERSVFDHSNVPDWLNPTTMRGLVLLLAGFLILTVPNFSEELLSLVVEISLIVIGVVVIWGAVTRRVRTLDALFGLGLVGIGVFLALNPSASHPIIADVIGGAFVLFGVLVAVRAIRQRKRSENWVFHFVRGGIYASFGFVVAFLPEAVLSSLVLALAIGAVLIGGLTLAIGLTDEDAGNAGPGELGAFARSWLADRDLGDGFRDEVVDALYFEPPDATKKQVGFWVLLVLSTSIATLGVLADSTAVVIGAMLVAPLMTPIMGVSAGIVNGWVKRVSTSFATVAGGVVVSITTAWIIAVWAPQLIPITANSQILSRVSPTMIDMMIAVAAGAAGAYATVDKRVSSSITGVAIAVALVPPLAVVGVTLHDTAYSDALGAFLLFATNLVSIILIASVVFVIGGLVPLDSMRQNSAKMRTIIGTVVFGAMVIVLPLAFTSEGIIASASRQGTAQTVTAAWIAPEPGLTLQKVTVSSGTVAVVITGDGAMPDINTLQSNLEASFGEPTEVQIQYFPSMTVSTEDQ